MRKFIVPITIILATSCSQKVTFDASGNFEADEVMVAAKQTGELLSYSVQEGSVLKSGENVGQIDVKTAELQKEQVEASMNALDQKTSNFDEQSELIKRQLSVQESQLSQMFHEKSRTENLVKADAATRKQLDDINAGIQQLQRQILVTRQQLKVNSNNVNTQNRAILSEKIPLSKNAAQFQELVDKGQITNPIDGTVLINYALKGEMQTVGKPLYKIANIESLNLRAYFTGNQLSDLKIGEKVTVRTDKSDGGYKNYPGIISWISSKAEFTPKTIQTKDERANLVYAAKIRVKNDGFLKIGMYGEVILPKNN